MSSRLVSIVGSLQTTWTGFVSECVAPGADQGGVDDRSVDVLVVVRHLWRISWTTFGRAFSDDEGQRGWMLSRGGRIYTEPDSLSRIFSSSTSTRSKVVLETSQRREKLSSLVCSLSLHLRLPSEGYMMVLAAPSRYQPTPQERAARRH